jgi:hypothetical protein
MPAPLRALIGAGLIAALAAGAGCGGHSQATAQTKDEASKAALVILRDARRAAHAAGTVHLVGVSSGGPGATTVDLELAAGRGGRGTATISGLSFSIVRSGAATYLRGDSAFNQRYAGSAAPLLHGRWFKVRSGRAPYHSFVGLTDMRGLLAKLLAPSTRTITKLGVSSVNGVQVIGLEDRGHGILYVAAHGSPYPVEIDAGQSGGGKLVFDHWGKPVKLQPPAGAVDLARLLRQTSINHLGLQRSSATL